MPSQDERDALQRLIAEGVPIDAKERYPFQLVGAITLLVPIRCKCRPNNFMQINGIGHTVTCDFCGTQYSIHQVVFNREDKAHDAEIGVAILPERPAVLRGTIVDS